MGIRIFGFLVTVMALVFGISAPAFALDAVIYEVTESVRVGKGGFKSSNATLTGAIAAGTALCPTWLATQLNIPACTIIVRAVGKADDTTGIGPASGDFDIAIQDANSVDGAEIVVMKGQINGTIDLSPAFVKHQPVGSITGRFTATGIKGIASWRARKPPERSRAPFAFPSAMRASRRTCWTTARS